MKKIKPKQKVKKVSRPPYRAEDVFVNQKMLYQAREELVEKISSTEMNLSSKITKGHLKITKNVNSQISGVNSKISGLDDRLIQLDHKVTQIDGRLTRLEVKVTQIDDKLTRLDHKVTQIDGRLTRLEIKVTQIDDRLTSLTAEVQKNQGTLHEIKAIVQGTKLLIEEQNHRNKITLDYMSAIYDKQMNCQERLEVVESKLGIIK